MSGTSNISDSTLIHAYGVFEGGGIKGTALVGALAASHALGIRFRGVGGTSAGAIVAALYAAGYREEKELQDLLLNAPFGEFLDGYSGPAPHATVRRLLLLFEGRIEQSRVLVEKLGKVGALGGIKLFLKRRNRQLVSEFVGAIKEARPLAERLTSEWGIYDGRRFQVWLEEALRDKLKLSKEVTFADLPKDVHLAVVATRLDPANPLTIYRSGENNPSSVARAVRRSMSIPFFFTPAADDGLLHVDGGVASNFPAWLFSDGLMKERDPLPILGFRLANTVTLMQEDEQKTPDNLLKFATAVFNAMLWASAPLQWRAVPRLHVVQLDVGTVDTFDFNLDKDARRALFKSAKTQSSAQLQELLDKRTLRRDRTPQLEKNLRRLCEDFSEAIGHPRSPLTTASGLKTARASLMIEAYDIGFRKVVCTFNFDGDDDGHLVLPKYSGLTGLAWLHPNRMIWADLAAVRAVYADPRKPGGTYGMPPDAQRLVRGRTKAMLAFGITPENSQQPIATLAVDTDVEIADDTVRTRAEDAFLRGVEFLAPWIERLYTE